MNDINYYIDLIIEHRQLIRKFDNSIKQNCKLIKRYTVEGNEEGVKFWKEMNKKTRRWREASRKLIEIYLDRIEEVRANDK